MSDKILPVQGGEVSIKYKDMGDGSHAQVMATDIIVDAETLNVNTEFPQGPSTAAESVSVTPSTDGFAVQIPAGATTIAKAEDTAHASGDVGVMVLGVRNDSSATLAGTDGDYTPVRVDQYGDTVVVGNVANDGVDFAAPVKIGGKANEAAPPAVAAGDRVDAWMTRRGRMTVAVAGVTPADGLTNYATAPVDSYDNAFPQSGFGYVFNGSTWDRLRGNTSALYVQGHVAHDAADSGSPVKIGGYAKATAPTAVADGDRVNAWYALTGEQYVSLTAGNGAKVYVGNAADALSALTAVAVISAPVVYNGSTYDRLRGDTNGLFVKSAPASTGSVTSVADSATSATLIAANTARRELRIFNNSDQMLYIKFGATASTTDFTDRIDPYTAWVDDVYTGRVDGIWAANSTGAALVTEVTV